MLTSRVGSDARIDQLGGCSPESCLSWPRSHKGCPKHDLFLLEYVTFSAKSSLILRENKAGFLREGHI